MECGPDIAIKASCGTVDGVFSMHKVYVIDVLRSQVPTFAADSLPPKGIPSGPGCCLRHPTKTTGKDT